MSASQLNNVELGNRGASAEMLRHWLTALDVDEDQVTATTTRRTRRAS